MKVQKLILIQFFLSNSISAFQYFRYKYIVTGFIHICYWNFTFFHYLSLSYIGLLLMITKKRYYKYPIQSLSDIMKGQKKTWMVKNYASNI